MRCAPLLAASLSLAACVGPQAGPEAKPTAVSAPAQEAAAPAPEENLPIRGEGPALPAADQLLSRVAIGSGAEETDPLPIFAAVAAARPELFLWVGDAVRAVPEPGEPEEPGLPKLRKAYGDLNLNAHFSAFNLAVPMLAVWDDHDYGLEDGGAEFPGRALSERLFESYWGPAALGADRPGVYGSRIFGPAGRRVQILMLDTRSFRSPLRPREPTPAGERRYGAQTDRRATLLGEAQWRWLEAELRRPAEVRLLVSSIPVLADGHAGEAWDKMPGERRRLFLTLARTRAKGVVVISGDRPAAALHRQTGLTSYTLAELGTSSLNLAFTGAGAERSASRIGGAYAGPSFGLVEIDWSARKLALSLRDLQGAAVRRLDLSFRELGL